MWMEFRNIYYIDLTPMRLSEKILWVIFISTIWKCIFISPLFYLSVCAQRRADVACIHSVTTPKLTIQHFLLFVFIPCFAVLWAGVSVCAAVWWLHLGNWFAWKIHEREDLRFCFPFDGSIHRSHSTCSYKKPWHKEETVDYGGTKSFHDTTTM